MSGIGHSSFTFRQRSDIAYLTKVTGEPSNISEYAMGDHRTIRAWKDVEFRESLDDEEVGGFAPSPVGTIELADEDIGDAAGGNPAITVTTICTTSLPCATGVLVTISNAISCGACETSLWHGSCYASSIGCC